MGETSGSPTDSVRALEATARALVEVHIPHVAIGSISLVAHTGTGWPRNGEDVDFLIKPDDVPRARALLEQRGFTTDDSGPDWLTKVRFEGTLIDLIFHPAGGMLLDEEMLSRAPLRVVAGTRVQVLSPEDFIAMQAFSHSEETPSHWFNALAVIEAVPGIDGEYLARRAKADPERILSLLWYAKSRGVDNAADALARVERLVTHGAHNERG
ncbi:MAG TPA: nucleotidyltransferase [Actinomycetota bacterium]|nr:nucleotidyltransferase [Actinomycetota bacterium]